MRISMKAMALCLAMAGAAILFAFSARAMADWPGVSPEELKMKENPSEPGAQAMILYREEIVNSAKSTDDLYYRIKIFTDEGKKYGDIEIPFFKGAEDIRDVRYRTIHPDGQVVESDSQVLEKLLVKAGDIKYLAKTFTVPDISPGSIIEYRYRIQRNPAFLYDCTWRIQEGLYTKRAHFVFTPTATTYRLMWRTFRSNASPHQQKDGSYTLDVSDVPGLPDEEYMLPVNELRGKVEFVYSREEHTKESKEYWDRIAKNMAEGQEKFIGKKSSMRDLVGRTVKSEDPPEEKLRKLYAAVQQIHNTDDDPEKTSQESKREKVKEASNVEDILKQGSATGGEVNLLFVALAQAAGYDSDIIWVATRDKRRFHPELQDRSELNSFLVWVRAGDKEYFLDPGIHNCPFGMLPWFETEITALRPTKQGAVYLQTPAMQSATSTTERKANLTLEMDGSLSGTLVIRFTGERAFSRRQNARDEDAEGKKKMVTDSIKDWLPSTAKFELTSITGWESADVPLEIQGKVKLTGMGESIGRRLLLPVGLYESGQRQLFDSSSRKQDIYFNYPYEDVDDITIQLPAGVQASTVPPPQVLDPGGKLKYQISAKQEGTSLHVQRKLVVGGILYPVNSYSEIRKFFSTAKSNDEQQVVLQAPGSGGH